MIPRGRFGDQLGSGSDPGRAPGGLWELPGAQKVDFGSTLGGQKVQKVIKMMSKVEKMRVDGFSLISLFLSSKSCVEVPNQVC